MDSECIQPHYKPLTKVIKKNPLLSKSVFIACMFCTLQVLSLPSNFTYNPPGSKRSEKRPSSYSQARRQTLHSQQPIMLANLDDIRNIDESLSDIYNIRECASEEAEDKFVRHHLQTNLDDIIALNRSDNFLRIREPEEKYPLKRINESNDANLLSLPVEQKPLHKLYGSTKHLFSRQKSMEITEETPFLLTPSVHVIEAPKSSSSKDYKGKELRIPKHDSQESVQRVITERRMLDENFKDIDQFDIFDVSTHSSEENLVEKDVAPIGATIEISTDPATDTC